MTNEITRQEKPGRLEGIKGLMLKPLSEKTCDKLIHCFLESSVITLAIGFASLNLPLIGLGASGLSYSQYLESRKKAAYDMDYKRKSRFDL